MLSDAQLQLLTAFVDGELSQRQRKDVLRLLHHSSEARDLLRQLQENVHRIKNLPLKPIPSSVADDVLFAIADSGLKPSAKPIRTPRRAGWGRYLLVAAAASLLLGPIAGYWFMNKPTEKIDLVEVAPPKQVEPIAPEPKPTVKRPPNPMIAKVIEGTYRDFTAPILPDKSNQPVNVAFRDLRNEGRATGILTNELASDKAVQLEVTVKNNAIALERIRSAFHDAGIKVVVEPMTEKALKKEGARTEYWVYAENLKPDEATKLFRELSQDDSKLQTFSKSPFEKLVITPLTGAEKKQVATQLGLDAQKLEPTKEQGGDFKRWDRTVVVLPPTSNAPSAETRNFATQRRAVQPGTVQMLVKIRHE